MAKRGRKSAAEMEVASLALAGASATAPDAPYDLSDDAAEIWRKTLDVLPAGFIAEEQQHLFAAFCRHAASVQFVSREIDRFNFDWLKADGGLERLNKLLAMRERESRAMLAAGRALRLTNQARYRPEKATRVAAAGIHRKPWEPT